MPFCFLPAIRTGTRELEACLAAWRTTQRPEQRTYRVLRWMLYALAMGIVLLMVLPRLARAGGPRDIAGTVFFESPTKGTPLTWAQGTITYYTDRGALSPVLTEAGADALVADAFSRWISISTAAMRFNGPGSLVKM
jgi:hypothetical protein